MAQVLSERVSCPKCDTVCSKAMRSIHSDDQSQPHSDNQLANPADSHREDQTAINTRIAQSYNALRADIAACEAAAGRAGEPDANRVTLLAVSKTRTAPEVAAAFAAGARHFGENYLQDALPKLEALSTVTHPGIVWHFIGAIQSNKTTDIARHFDWVHTVDRLKIARRLSNARPEHLLPLNLCIQVNLHNEAQKAGVSKAELPDLLAAIRPLPGLAVRGLMILPAATSEPRVAFDELAALFADLAPNNPDATVDAGPWDTLSMGMSGDYPAAIAAGSTMVRIGTALFGPRRT